MVPGRFGSSYFSQFVRDNEFLLVLFNAFLDLSSLFANNLIVEQPIEKFQGEDIGVQLFDPNIVDCLAEELPFASFGEHFQCTDNSRIFEEILESKSTRHAHQYGIGIYQNEFSNVVLLEGLIENVHEGFHLSPHSPAKKILENI